MRRRHNLLGMRLLCAKASVNVVVVSAAAVTLIAAARPLSADAALFFSQSARGGVAQIESSPSVPDIFRGILAPARAFFENLSRIGEGNGGGPLSTGLRFADFDLGEFLSRFDERFYEITGLSFGAFFKAIVGITLWIFEGIVKILQWAFGRL